MNGKFGYYRLIEWWETSFTKEERIRLRLCYKHEEDYHGLIYGNIYSSSQSVIGFLETLANNLACLKEYALAFKFLSKGGTLKEQGTATDTHFLYRAFLEYYSESSPHYNTEKLIENAQKQIDISALAAKEMIDKDTWYRIAHKGYEVFYEYLKTSDKKEEAKLLKAKAKKEKWNYMYLD